MQVKYFSLMCRNEINRNFDWKKGKARGMDKHTMKIMKWLQMISDFFFYMYL